MAASNPARQGSNPCAPAIIFGTLTVPAAGAHWDALARLAVLLVAAFELEPDRAVDVAGVPARADVVPFPDRYQLHSTILPETCCATQHNMS